jgi:hypothetical protein
MRLGCGALVTIGPKRPVSDMRRGQVGYFASTLICRATVTGSVKANVEPWPSCDSTQILPPCISTMRFEMASPSPVPPFLRVTALSACWNS